MEFTIRRDSQGNLVRFLLFEEVGMGGAMTGLHAHSDGLRVACQRDDDHNPQLVPLSPWEGNPHIPGGFREIDPVLMPGLYELALPDELCAEGAHRVTLMILAPDVQPQVIHINLVGYDPYDQYRLGLDCLTREARHEVISRAFREVLPDVVRQYLQGTESATQQGEKIS